MPFTLVKAGEAATDALTKGIIEIVLKDSPILQKLPFITIEGNSLTYWREKAVARLAAWYAAGAPWSPVQPETEECSAVLKILGGLIDFDNFTRRTRPSPEDYEASLVELKAKALRHEFEDKFINGTGASNTFQGLDALVPVHAAWKPSTAYALGVYVHATTFNGFRYECTTAGTSDITEPTWPLTEGETVEDGTVVWTCRRSQLVSMGTNGAALTLRKLDELIDKVAGGKPDLLLISRRTNRDLNHLIRTSGAVLETRPGMFGEFIQLYNGIPVGVNDWIADTSTVGSSTNCSTAYAFQMSEGALAGLASPEMIKVERVGQLEGYDAERIRTKWYVSLALFSAVKLARLIGIRPVS